MTKRQPGFTLIEVVISIVILSTAVLAISTLFVSNVATVSLGKAKTVGLALANQQMEYLRDLPYDSLATTNGTIYPPGNIADDQNVTSGNYKFRIHTVISYVDDPYDGNAQGTIQGKPTDLYPYDYKLAEISVYLRNNNKLVASLTTNIGAKAAETASNTGILQVSVIDANGNPVQNASVHITNSTSSPAVDITTTTDNNGIVEIPKLPPDSNKDYQITATLVGYNTDLTEPDPVGAQTPVNSNVNILVQQITHVTLSIDRLSTLNLHVVDTSGNPISNLAITTTSSKKLYTNPDVFKYNQTTSTDTSGNITLSSMEWGGYSFSVPSGHYLVVSSPYLAVSLNPNASQSVTLTVSTSSTWPRIISVSPASGTIGTAALSVTITGANLSSGSSALLRLAGQSDINFTGVSANGSTLTGTINLSSVVAGNWDIVITSNGNTTTQPGGFNVSN